MNTPSTQIDVCALIEQENYSKLAEVCAQNPELLNINPSVGRNVVEHLYFFKTTPLLNIIDEAHWPLSAVLPYISYKDLIPSLEVAKKFSLIQRITYENPEYIWPNNELSTARRLMVCLAQEGQVEVLKSILQLNPQLLEADMPENCLFALARAGFTKEAVELASNYLSLFKKYPNRFYLGACIAAHGDLESLWRLQGLLPEAVTGNEKFPEATAEGYLKFEGWSVEGLKTLKQHGLALPPRAENYIKFGINR